MSPAPTTPYTVADRVFTGCAVACWSIGLDAPGAPPPPGGCDLIASTHSVPAEPTPEDRSS